ncbi:MAG: ABC transporter substrate-binding protein [Bacteroidetes bacterium]|nr:ABC transporter substrate-binding protein [Bacteroidota bacterium]
MKKLQFSVLLSLFLVGNFACTKQKETTYVPYGGEAIHVGVLLPLTGSGNSSGQSMQASLELARQDIAGYFASAGIAETLVVDIADTRTDTAEALKQLKLFYGKGIRMIIGPYSSAEVAHIKSFADTHDMLIISPSSVAVSLAIPDDNIFRFVSSDVIQGKAMSKMLTEDKIRVIVPLIRDDLWGHDLVAATGADFIKSGGMVQPSVKFDAGTTDFSHVLDKLDTAVAAELTHHNPNEVAVYMLSFAEGTKIMAEAKQHSHLNNVYWYGGSAFALNASMLSDTNAALFSYTHGLPCPAFGLDDAAKNRWLPLRDRIEQQISRIPDVYAFTAYDALWVLTDAYRAAGRDASFATLKYVFVNEAASYFGASGNTQLDKNGDRAVGNYDFWAVKSDSTGYGWKRVARYNSLYGTLTRLTE